MTFIETPKAADVLCGKDKTFGKHPGNMLYRDLIEAKALDYAAAVYKLDKMKLTTEIVATMVTEFGTRFLRPVGIPTNRVAGDSNGASTTTTNSSNNSSDNATMAITADGNATTDMIGWEEISLTAARDKTSHALRFCAANTMPNLQHRAAAAAAGIVAPTADLSHSATTTTAAADSSTTTASAAAAAAPGDSTPAATTTTSATTAVTTSTTTATTASTMSSDPADSSADSIPNGSNDPSAAKPPPTSSGAANGPTSKPVPTSLIHSQLLSATGAYGLSPDELLQRHNEFVLQQKAMAQAAAQSMSQEERLQQQNNALQKGIEELIQQKIKQKEQEQKRLEQVQRMQMQLAPAAAADSTGPVTNGTAGIGLRKFKKLPIKASKPRAKIIPTAELLNSTVTPVRFSRVKVQKSSRKPKVVASVVTNGAQGQPQQPITQAQQQQQQGQAMKGQHNFRSPSQVSPMSSPYNGQGHYLDNHQPPEQAPQEHPPASNVRTVSTDMIVLAHAAAVVEAAEAEERAFAAEQTRKNEATNK